MPGRAYATISSDLPLDGKIIAKNRVMLSMASWSSPLLGVHEGCALKISQAVLIDWRRAAVGLFSGLTGLQYPDVVDVDGATSASIFWCLRC